MATGRRPKTDGFSGLRVVRALERAEESMRSSAAATAVIARSEQPSIPGSELTVPGGGAVSANARAVSLLRHRMYQPEGIRLREIEVTLA